MGSALRACIGAGLLALGPGLGLVGSSLAEAKVTPDARDAPLNPSARDPADIRANNSPTVARNPRSPAQLVAVNRVDTPAYSCALHTSSDGGSTWREGRIPFPAGEELPERCFAPDAAYALDGTLHIAFATLKGMGNSPNAVWTTSSPDGGRSLSAPVQALGPLTFQFRLLADPAKATRIYLTYLRAEAVGLALFPNTGNPIEVVRSEDGGASWLPPVRVSPPARLRVVAPSMAFGPGGQLYVLYLDLGDDRLDYNGGSGWRAGEPYGGLWTLVLARSTDQGATWREAVVDAAVVPTKRFLIFLPESPSLAVSPDDGRVYVGFADGDLGDPDVWVRASGDEGTTFGPRRRVNDTPLRDGTDQYLPRLGVAPNGRLDVVYYDRRADPENVMNEVSFQTSFDGGRSFVPRARLSSVAFDSRIGFGSHRGLPDLGSRLGLLTGDRETLAVWTDTRAGTAENRKQDLARAKVRFSEASPWKGPLRAAGWAVCGAGLAMVAWAVAGLGDRRRRPGPAQAEAPDIP